MAYNNLIRANDPMAINMLKENLAHFENNIAYMQAVNDYYKANGTMVNFEGIRSEERRVGKECRSRWSPYH